ncbi:hypothetical protein CH75_09200 [Dyella jiangningensis]|nr:hypothetical protein CH75_09200 [Dyella jiangningensis]
MTATIDLLDQYIKARSLTSDNAAAKSLGIGRAAVSKWRNGLGHPDADNVATMCAATGQAIAHWLPLIEAERARNPEARKVWLRLAQLAAAVTLAVGLYPAHAETITAHADVSNSATSIHYAKLKMPQSWLIIVPRWSRSYCFCYVPLSDYVTFSEICGSPAM